MLAAASNKWAERFTACARGWGRWLVVAICFVVATAMFGCSMQRASENQYASPAPSSSYPSVPSRGRLEVASWYGPGFVGHVTSDGEIYNPNELTAASKTLPIGSYVRVTNPDNGHSVVVRINDRGPYVRGRSLDLSRSAAGRIGMTHEGVCRVRVRKVSSEDSASTVASSPYIRRTAYHQSRRRPLRRRRVSQSLTASSDSKTADSR
jgi:rare lipoprotein A (peptidoglycan hydrolase)